jgi:hypothetical protein
MHLDLSMTGSVAVIIAIVVVIFILFLLYLLNEYLGRHTNQSS